MSKTCSATKRDGTRCNLPAQEQKDRCWAHAPEYREQRRRIASRGGKGKANTPVKELRQQLDEITERVLNGSLVPYRGSVAAQLINAKIRLLEIERKDQERQESEERLARLEALERGRGRFWGA